MSATSIQIVFARVPGIEGIVAVPASQVRRTLVNVHINDVPGSRRGIVGLAHQTAVFMPVISLSNLCAGVPEMWPEKRRGDLLAISFAESESWHALWISESPHVEDVDPESWDPDWWPPRDDGLGGQTNFLRASPLQREGVPVLALHLALLETALRLHD